MFVYYCENNSTRPYTFLNICICGYMYIYKYIFSSLLKQMSSAFYIYLPNTHITCTNEKISLRHYVTKTYINLISLRKDEYFHNLSTIIITYLVISLLISEYFHHNSH